MRNASEPPNGAGISVGTREALVVLLALLAGIGAGVLLRVDGASLAHVTLGAAGAWGLSLRFFDKLLR
jgi:hypothetical protein